MAAEFGRVGTAWTAGSPVLGTKFWASRLITKSLRYVERALTVQPPPQIFRARLTKKKDFGQRKGGWQQQTRHLLTYEHEKERERESGSRLPPS